MATEPREQPNKLFAAKTAPGEWPAAADDLPMFLTQRQLAHLLGKSVRTLERDRVLGGSIPFKKVGRTVLYARQDVLNFLDAASFRSTREVRASRAA